MQKLRLGSGFIFPIALPIILLLSSCATPGVTKSTGRLTDPPLELVLYCLLAPADPACRGILK